MPRAMVKPRPQYTFDAGVGSGTAYVLVPAAIATIYNINPLFNAGYSGQGQTIVLIEDTNMFSVADWNTFRTAFGLSSYAGTLTQVHPSGAAACTNPGIILGNEAEATLDVEWASAAAPSAAIELASCADVSTTFGGLLALENIVNSTPAPTIVSISYGECETVNGATANAAYNSAYQQAAAEGISVFVSAGDEGAASCDANQTGATDGIGVSAFASTAYNVAVGGTDFADSYMGAMDAGVSNATYWGSANSGTFGSALSYVPEIPWNDSCASVLVANFLGFPTTYGAAGSCNSGTGLLTTASGSGGPSGCATGSSSSPAVGGTCTGYPKPSWQKLLGNPNDGVRDLPDVSLFAADGIWGHAYVYCDSDAADPGQSCSGLPLNWSLAGGTSFASPILAGIQALVNQRWGAQGNPNPSLYSLARTEYGASGSAACNSSNGSRAGAGCVFYDVTLGDIDINCTGPDCYAPSGTNGVLSTSSSAYDMAFGTQTGWDFATGIGTVNAANLVTNAIWGDGVKLVMTLRSNSTAGVTTSVSVNAVDGFGNAIPGYASALTFTSSDPRAALPSSAPFSNGTTGALQLTFDTSGAQTLTARSSTNAAVTVTGGITVSPGATASYLFQGLPAFADAGVALGFTVAAIDAYGNVTPAYSGTSHFTSSDALAALPADASFQAGASGSLTVTMQAIGPDVLTATDTVNPTITGSTTVTLGQSIANARMISGTFGCSVSRGSVGAFLPLLFLFGPLQRRRRILDRSG
jgi:subtilase family serine protease